jgi:PhnB protein
MTDVTITAPETAARPDPATMRGVIPHLGLDGRAAEAADFYVKAFGAQNIGRFPDADNPGRYLHIHLEVNGGALMMTDCRAPWESRAEAPKGFNLMLIVDDGDAWWRRAVEAGCEIVMPFERMFWGDRWGMLRDPFGVEWAIDEPGPEG